MKIRKHTDSDVDSIIRIWLEASIKAHNFVDPKFWQDKVDDMRNIYIPNSETWVYEENKEVLGFFSLSGNTLAAIFVNPHYQGKGIGRKLIEKAKSLKQSLELTVYSENTRSILFYKKQGFKIVKEQKDIHTGHKEIVMTFGK